ncbi:MAG: hypothetical protein ABI831_20155 [Betaproteobacteria bacterium]
MARADISSAALNQPSANLQQRDPMPTPTLPEQGLPPATVFAEMEDARRNDVDWRRGRLGLHMHYAGGVDMFAVAEQLTAKDWFVSTMSNPPGIHLGMPTMAHVPHVEEYLGDLAAAVAAVPAGQLTAKSHSVTCGG